MSTILGALIGAGAVLLGQRYAYIFQCRSRIHEHQTEILWKLYKCLLEVQEYAQRRTRRFTFKGERTEDYPALFNKALENSWQEFSRDCLLLPNGVEEQVNAFFQKVIQVQVELGLAENPMVPDGQQRATYWENAGKIAYQAMPQLLETIKEQARHIIYSETEDIISVLKAKINRSLKNRTK